MIICHYCHKRIRFDERVFYVDPYEPLHYGCVGHVLACRARRLKEEKERKKQMGIYRWMQ